MCSGRSATCLYSTNSKLHGDCTTITWKLQYAVAKASDFQISGLHSHCTVPTEQKQISTLHSLNSDMRVVRLLTHLAAYSFLRLEKDRH